MRRLRLVAISDTHEQHDHLDIPDGDLLIHAGDLTRRGALDAVREFNAFLSTLPHTHKVVIAGNHDFCFQHRADDARACLTHAHYLQDGALTLDDLCLYGSPWQPVFHNWAFNLPRGDALRRVWSKIPNHVDVLITHGPPRGHGDRVHSGERVGCADLLAAIQRIQPCVHIFGHIHEDHGVSREGTTLCVNASVCNWGTLAWSPVVIDLERAASGQWHAHVISDGRP